ncbi:hypothetical protein EVAR_43979_1 [Eumeta japonica]|uniref:Uncharacterized protein n=1 Tax=Eumeta variegata TaxID=151549 RepID=A0A4C1XGU4_EUMVA|nr:hypothetical protein EVAR_43979_1 [Eumeta japonica]
MKSYLSSRVQRADVNGNRSSGSVILMSDTSALSKVKRQRPTHDDVNNAISKRVAFKSESNGTLAAGEWCDELLSPIEPIAPWLGDHALPQSGRCRRITEKGH